MHLNYYKTTRHTLCQLLSQPFAESRGTARLKSLGFIPGSNKKFALMIKSHYKPAAQTYFLSPFHAHVSVISISSSSVCNPSWAFLLSPLSTSTEPERIPPHSV